MEKTKVVFFGNDQYSEIVLNALKNDENFKLVNSLADRPIVGVLASYGKIISQETIDDIPLGILNLHPSLLPKYRGPSPVQTAIINGEKETGITIMKMDAQIDHGPIVAQIKEKIRSDDTSQSLYNRLFSIGAGQLLEILPEYLADSISLVGQNHSQATFTKKLQRDSGFIPIDIISIVIKSGIYKVDKYTLYADLFMTEFNPITPEIIEQAIRAFTPWPGIWTEIKIDEKNKRLKILKSHLEKDKLIIDEIQLEGKNPVSFRQFVEGYPEIVKEYF